MADTEPKRLIATVERATDVLTLFTKVDRQDLGVTEIANELQLSKAVIHRVLNTLAAKGFIETDEETRRYRLGPAVLALGEAYVDRLDIRGLALPHMKALSEQTNETATISRRYRWERLYVDQVTPEREVKMTVALGRRFPLHAGGSSKAFLAFLSLEDQEAYIAQNQLDELTEHTITDADALRRDLALTRERGYASSEGERQSGASSVAAPVMDHRGEPIAVLSICGPQERFQEVRDHAIELLLETTRTLTRHMGGDHSPRTT